MQYGRVVGFAVTPRLAALAAGFLMLACLSGQALAKGKHRHHGAKDSDAADASGSAPGPKCAAAWRAAVERQKAGHLDEAKTLFGACRLSSCLPAVRKECSKQYAQMSRSSSPSGSSEAPETTASSLGPTCGGAWKAGVERQKAGKLNEARDLFAACRQAACLPAVRKECAKLHDQLEADIPSVVAVVTDASGEPRTDVEIKVDGKLLAPQLDGRSVAVDPGVHEFSFASKEGAEFGTQKIMVAEGQHHRLISAAVPGAEGAAPVEHKTKAVAGKKPPPAAKVNLALNDAAAKAAKSDDDDSADSSDDADTTLVKKADGRGHAPALTYVLSGTGVVGLAGFGLLTYWGRKDADLLGPCSPACPASSATHIKRLYLGADISLGVGVAALAGAYWAYAHAKSSQPEESATETAYTFGVQPAAAGAVGTVSGTF